MSWTDFTRGDYARRSGRYVSDLTDREWELIGDLLPAPRRPGRPRKTGLREVADALLHLASTGCQWRMLPKDFPPFTTVQSCSTNGAGIMAADQSPSGHGGA